MGTNVQVVRSRDRWVTKIESGEGSRSYHVVVNSGGGWSVKRAGSEKADRVFPVQEEAINFARSVLKREGGELVVHSRNGRIRAKDTYGLDPHPPRDKNH